MLKDLSDYISDISILGLKKKKGREAGIVRLQAKKVFHKSYAEIANICLQCCLLIYHNQ